MRATYSVLISLDLPGQVLDIVKSLTSELRLSSLNNILTSVVEEIYVLHEKEDWVLDMSDQVNILSSDSKYFLEVSIIFSSSTAASPTCRSSSRSWWWRCSPSDWLGSISQSLWSTDLPAGPGWLACRCRRHPPKPE